VKTEVEETIKNLQDTDRYLNFETDDSVFTYTLYHEKDNPVRCNNLEEMLDVVIAGPSRSNQ